MTWLSKDPLAKLKIRYKLPLSFVMISLIAFGLGGYLIINTVHSSLFREIQTRLKSETIAQSSVFDQHLLMLGRRAQDFASDGFIRTQTELIAHSDSIDPDVQEGLINHLKINKLPIVEEFTNLHIFNTEGIRLISVNTPETAIENIVSFGFTQDTLWYSSLFSASDEGSSPLFAIVTPLINIRKTMPIGYLVCVVDFSRILTYISEHYQNALSFSDTEKYLTFLDQSGVFLNIPWWTLNRQENINLLDLSIQRTDLPVTAAIETHRNLHICTRGQEMFGYSFPLKYVDWTILVELSTSNALKTVKSLEERLFLVGLFIAVLILVAMYFPVRFLIRPLGELESMAFTIKEGDYSARVKTESEDEIGDLALSFNQMAEALEERTAVLDKTTKNLAKREKEIRIQHDRLTTVVNSMNDGLILLDSSGKIVLHNDAGKILSDYLLQSTKNIEKFECKNPDDAELPPCSHCLMDLNSMQGCTLKIDHRYIEVLSTRIPGLSGGTGKILVSRDITERTLIHEKHSRQERLAVLGNMAAVVAHEMNSPLAAISMYVQMMADDEAAKEPFGEHIDVIHRNTETCREIITNLLDFARTPTMKIGDVDIHELINQTIRLLVPLHGKSNISIKLFLNSPRYLIEGDLARLKQVFANIILNAIQAVKDTGGNITIRTATAESDEFLIIDVADDGPGIKPEISKDIFNPFFTTRGSDMGTGLGLSTAKRIVELHGGSVVLHQNQPRPTLFRITLPFRFRGKQEIV